MAKLHKIFCYLWPWLGPDNAICHVLLALWMTSLFHTMGPMGPFIAESKTTDQRIWLIKTTLVHR